MVKRSLRFFAVSVIVFTAGVAWIQQEVIEHVLTEQDILLGVRIHRSTQQQHYHQKSLLQGAHYQKSLFQDCNL
mgnify:CR=1 FL=1